MQSNQDPMRRKRFWQLDSRSTNISGIDMKIFRGLRDRSFFMSMGGGGWWDLGGGHEKKNGTKGGGGLPKKIE